MKNPVTAVAVLGLFTGSLIFAQPEPILPAQISAIETLAKKQGFSEETLDAYLKQEWGAPVASLTKEDGTVLIRLFQSPNAPTPADIQRERTRATAPEPVSPGMERKRARKIIIAELLEVGMSKRFHLVDGNIIEGEIKKIEGGICYVETIDGMLEIPGADILDETARITKKDGTRYIGPVLRETSEEIVLRSAYGDVIISKRDIRDMDRYHGGRLVPWAEEKKTFYQAEELLTDIFMDPTAFGLTANTFYISGLSIGYGFTDWLMVRSKFGSDFAGDLNLHPLIRFYHRRTGTTERAAAIGFHVFNHHPMKSLVAKYARYVTNGSNSLDKMDTVSVASVMKDSELSTTYGELYVVLSSRRSLATRGGRMGWHVGAKTNTLSMQYPELISGWKWDKDEFLVPYRLWFGFEYDLSKNLNFQALMWADNGHKFRSLNQVWDDYFTDGSLFVLDSPKGDYRFVDFDFGFLYAVSETFRVGIHFQEPYLVFYWEFFEL